jgi:hypothetical protein
MTRVAVCPSGRGQAIQGRGYGNGGTGGLGRAEVLGRVGKERLAA